MQLEQAASDLDMRTYGDNKSFVVPWIMIMNEMNKLFFVHRLLLICPVKYVST